MVFKVSHERIHNKSFIKVSWEVNDLKELTDAFNKLSNKDKKKFLEGLKKE